MAIKKVSAADREKCRILTPEFRVSFPHVFKAQAMPGTKNDPKYSITMLFPKDEDLGVIKAAIKQAKINAFGPNKDDWPEDIQSPVGDGDGKAGINKKTKERLEGYADHWVIKASTSEDQKPSVVDYPGCNEIIEPSKFYSGCYARASVFAYVWEFPKDSGEYGVGFILDHVQKLREGPSFAGKKSAEAVFKPHSKAGDDDDADDDSEDFM